MATKILFIVLALALQLVVSCQSHRLFGCIYDAANREPIPFATVGVLGTSIGVVTDMNGCYSLLYMGSDQDSVAFGSLGYEGQRLSVAYCKDKKMDIFLERTDLVMEEIIVFAADNPALKIKDSVYANFYKHRLSTLENFSNERYSKVELDLVDFDSSFIDKNPFIKRFDFVLDMVDSNSEEKPFLPLFLTEVVTANWDQNIPKRHCEITLANQVSGFENANYAQFLNFIGTEAEFERDVVSILGKQFVAPFAQKGCQYYDYYLLDSAKIDEDFCYKIKVEPVSQSDYLFSGDIWVVKSDWSIKQLSLEMVKDVNINFVKRASIFQSFKMVNGRRFLNKDKLVVEFLGEGKTIPGLIGRRTNSYARISYNEDSITRRIENWVEEDPVAAADRVAEGNLSMARYRHERLTANEIKIYELVDTLQEIKLFNVYVDLIQTFFTGYHKWGIIDFGPYYNLLSSDQIEGWRVGMGFRTNKRLAKKWRLDIAGAYGLRDDRWKYKLGWEWIISRKKWTSLRLERKHDLDLENGDVSELDNDNLVAGLVRKPMRQRLNFLDQNEITYFRQISRNAQLTLSAFQLHQTPYFEFTRLGNFSNLKSIRTAGVKLRCRYTKGEKFLVGRYTRSSLQSKNPIFYLNVESSINGFMESEYDYTKIEGKIVDQWPFRRLGYGRIQMSASHVFGSVPMLLRSIPKGNDTYYFNPGAFNSLLPYDMVSDGMVTLHYSQYFDGLLLKNIPLLKRTQWRSVLSARGLVGWTRENISHPINQNYLYVSAINHYAEVSLGIENIFKFLRFDLVKRITPIFRSEDNSSRYNWVLYSSLQFKL